MEEKNNNLSYRTLKYFFNENIISRVKKLKMLKFDNVSYYSLTPYKYSNEIIEIISTYMDPKKSEIVDACACIGGDTINFCKSFKNVIAIEIDKTRYEYLNNNLNCFDITNCTTINNDCHEIIKNINTDIIYYDLPWNGKKYKNKKQMKLYLGKLSLESLCIINYNRTKMICLKIPNNYDIEDMKKQLSILYVIDIYNLKKFKLVILIKKIKLNLKNRKMNNLFLLDIDNTLLIPKNIFIYYHKDGVDKKYTPEEYAKIDVTKDEKKYFDYNDFRNAEIIKKSIETSIPLKKNLEIVKKYIEDGWKIGILTARGQQDIIKDTMEKWLEQQLHCNIPYLKEEVYAVNDETIDYPGYSDATKKLNVIKNIISNNKYDNLCVIDDNKYSIDIINKNNENLPVNKHVKTIYVKND